MIAALTAASFAMSVFFSIVEISNCVLTAGKNRSAPILNEVYVAISWGVFFYLFYYWN